MFINRIAVLTVILAVSSFALAGPYAPKAGDSGSTAIHMDDAAFVAWATGHENCAYGSNVDDTWKTPDKALGKAVGSSTDIVCLGRGGEITLTFGPEAITNGSGWDFAVFENSFRLLFYFILFYILRKSSFIKNNQ